MVKSNDLMVFQNCFPFEGRDVSIPDGSDGTPSKLCGGSEALDFNARNFSTLWDRKFICDVLDTSHFEDAVKSFRLGSHCFHAD